MARNAKQYNCISDLNHRCLSNWIFYILTDDYEANHVHSELEADLPQSVIIHEPESYTREGEPIEIDEPMPRESGERNGTFLTTYGRITIAYRALWKALTKKSEISSSK